MLKKKEDKNTTVHKTLHRKLKYNGPQNATQKTKMIELRECT